MKKFIVLLSILLFLIISCRNQPKKEIPIAKNGTIDLRNWDLKKDGPVKLDGEWNFFWKQFIPPSDIKKQANPSKISVPKVWSSQKINDTYLNRHGYGTYYLRVLLNPIDTPLAIKFPTVGAAYEAYINGVKIKQVGKVGKTYDDMIPAYGPDVVNFVDQSKELDIVIYVSSFHQKYSGLWYSLIFGDYKDVGKIRDRNLGETYLFIGILLMMFFYHIGLVALRPKEKLPLYFALACLMLAIRDSSLNEIILLNFFPELSLNVLKKIEFISLYLLYITSNIYTYKLFQEDFSKKILWTLIIPVCILTIITLVTPTEIFTFLIVIFQGILAATLPYVIYVTIVAIIKKRESSILFLIGFIIYFIFVVNDILFALYMINTGFYYQYGLLAVIFCQSFLLSAKFSSAFFSVEKLTSTLEVKNLELTDLNLNLEQKVEERTEELVAANEEMQAINDNLIETKEELEASNEEMKSINESLIEAKEELEAANEEMTAINEKLTETRNELWGEMQIAKKIQTVLLPTNPKISGYEILAYMEPANDVGGDYYDIINCKGYDWLIIGDVSGHGLPAGLIMMMVQTAIHASLERNPNDDPSQLLTVINKTIKNNIDRLDDNKYMTITVFAVIKNGRFIYSGLHQDILIYRNDTQEVEIVETEGSWIGIFDEIQPMLHNQELMINKGDIVLLYTDGITEAWIKGSVVNQRNVKMEMYGHEQLVNVFKKSASFQNLAEMQKHILGSLNNYVYDDDITLVLVKRIE